jgi:hypothetical protein
MNIKPGSQWVRKETRGGYLKGEIITVYKVANDWVSYDTRSLKIPTFLYNFEPYSLANIHTVTTGISSTTKEQTMTIQDLLTNLFGGTIPTDYDKRPAILVVAYNRDGSEMGTATADNIDQVTSKVKSTPELWGCKVLTYKISKEIFVDVPVSVQKATIQKDN